MESQSIYANTACNWWYRAGSASFRPAIGGHPPPFFSYPLTAVMLLYAAGVKTRDISLSFLLMRLHSRIGVLLI